jgi:hypothetical protein
MSHHSKVRPRFAISLQYTFVVYYALFQSYNRFSYCRLWRNVNFDCYGASETGSDVSSR